MGINVKVHVYSKNKLLLFLQQTEKLSKLQKKSGLTCKLDNFQFLPVAAMYNRFEEVLYICH